MRNVICGIIKQAITDWKNAYYVLNRKPTEEECKEILEKQPENIEAKRRLYRINRAKDFKQETEIFFKSDWYRELKEASEVALPKDILSALYEEVKKEEKKKRNKMTRDELEKVLADNGWTKNYHGTHSVLWQKEHQVIDVSDKGAEIGGSEGMLCPRLPWYTTWIKDGRLIVHWEVEL